MTYQWDSADYALHSAAQFDWARELISKLHLTGDETLLDIGCGDGKITASLARLLPRGSVTGIDSSENMVMYAKTHYSNAEYRNLTFQIMDATDLRYEDHFDVVISSATFHWIQDHISVLAGIKRCLKKTGRTLFQMGGRGNAREMIQVMDAIIEDRAWRPYFTRFIFPYWFYGPDEYRVWLADVGLEAQRRAVRVRLAGESEGLAGWIRTAWLPYVERVPRSLRESFISEIVSRYLRLHPPDEHGNVHVEMMRLEVEAIKP